MRYQLEIDADVRQYLAGLSMTRQGRLALYAHLYIDFPALADGIRATADRSAPDSSLFLHHYLFLDGGRSRSLRLAVDDSSAAYGVLRVVYADCA